MGYRWTYHSRVDKGSPVITFFEQGQNKGNSSGSEENEDQLVLELLQNQFPERGWGIFSQG